MYNTLYRTALVVTALFLLTAGPVAAQDSEMADDQPDIVDTAVQGVDGEPQQVRCNCPRRSLCCH